jgi:hypothetical protein
MQGGDFSPRRLRPSPPFPLPSGVRGVWVDLSGPSSVGPYEVDA